MADQADRVDLWCVADHLRANSDFMAGWCTARPGAFQVLVDELGLDRVRAAQLMICKTPRPNQYDHDLTAIAGAIGADPARFAAAMTHAALVGNLLRAVSALLRW